MGYKQCGHEVVVLNHGRDGPRRKILESAEIRVETILSIRREALDDLNLGGFDVVHIHREGRRNDRETALLDWAARHSRLIVETNVFFARDYSVGEKYIDLHFHLAEINQARWLKRGGAGASAVIPYPVDPMDFPIPLNEDVLRFRRSLGIPDEGFVFGRIGQPAAGKWDPIIISAFSKVAGRESENYLLLVGPSPEIVAQVSALDESVRRRIEVLDVIDSPEKLGICYAAMNCFLHAARQGESFGYVLAEALLHGVPVITVSRPHRDNAQTEVVRHGIDGLVVRSRSGVLQAMRSIMRNEDLRTKIQNEGRMGVVERFGTEAVCGKALNIFESILQWDVSPVCMVGKIQYDTIGVGDASLRELMLARFYDIGWVDFCIEGLRYRGRAIRNNLMGLRK